MLEPTRRPRWGGHPLQLEALEDRAVPAVIGGAVYDDVNRNGLIGLTEFGIAGSQLRLLDANGQLVATTTSDAHGRYQFSKREAGAAAPATVTHEATFAPTRTDVR